MRTGLSLKQSPASFLSHAEGQRRRPGPQQPCAEQAGPGRASTVPFVPAQYGPCAGAGGSRRSPAWPWASPGGSAGPAVPGPGCAPSTRGFWDLLVAGCALSGAGEQDGEFRAAFSLFPTLLTLPTHHGGAVECFMCVRERTTACLGHIHRVRIS